MDNFLMLVLNLVTGALVSLLVELGKKWNISPRILVVLFSVIAAGLYQVYILFVPLESQKSVVEFGVATLTTAVFVYSFMLKWLDERGKTKKY